MILVTEATRKQIAEIVRAMDSGALSQIEGARQMHAVDPEHFLPYLFLGQEQAAAGNLDAAESLYWQGLERGPCSYALYLSVGAVRGVRDHQDPLSVSMKVLAFSKMALAGEVDDEIVEQLRDLLEGSSLDLKNPEDIELFAGILEAQTNKDKPEPAEVAGRLRPYRTFYDLQRQAPDDVSHDVLERLRENADACVPILRAALGEWSRLQGNLSPQALRLVVALLGELGSADILDDLLELSMLDDDELFLHANWAIRRIGQRFPSETFAKLRAAIPTAPLSMRCGIADHLGLLPESVDIEPAASELLRNFSDFTEHGDAAYLLMDVTNGLAERGHRAEALAFLARYQGLLPAHDRKWLREERADFVPNLVREEIDQLDIEDVVLHRVYMDDEGEEDEEEEEEEDYEDEPVRRPVKPGRNDPCWCGSGKKYKKCHLVSDEEEERSAARTEGVRTQDAGDAEPEPPPGNPLYKKVFDDVIGASQDWIGRKDFLRATRLYFDQHPGDLDSESMGAAGFFEWYVYDFRPAGTGRTAVEEYLKRRGPRLPARERAMLESWRAARYGLFEVQRVDEGSGLELEDLLAGGRFFVHDVSASRELVRWDCVMNRVEQFEGRWLFGGNGILVPRPLLPELRRFIEEESRKDKQAPADFVRANSHLWHRIVQDLHEDRMEGLQIVNAENDPIEFCVATYRVLDEDAASAALLGIEGIEETTSPKDAGGLRSFGWLETGKEGPRRSYGHIEMRDGRLRLECNSRGRMERGRRLLEDGAGAFLEHLGDSIESAQAAMRRVKREGPPKEREAAIPPEVAREVLLKYKTEHYATWADTPLPAMKGKTPREAMATESGRRDVENLIRLMENGEARERKEGQAAFDFSKIREELGLPTPEMRLS